MGIFNFTLKVPKMKTAEFANRIDPDEVDGLMDG